MWRLGASEVPSVADITACLRRETATLSAGCRAVMDTADRGVPMAKAEMKIGPLARNRAAVDP